MSTETNQVNIAETLAKEMKSPVEIISATGTSVRRVALPPGWKLEERDDERLYPSPRRKAGAIRLDDAESFISYIKRHGSLTDSTIWCQADYANGDVDFKSILNDHGETEDRPDWRDHTASFQPAFSAEWTNWSEAGSKQFKQADFAAFIESNLKDIVSVDGSPSGTQMLEMALNFEANQDMRFKSAIRLQSGGVEMAFVQGDDAQTLAKMKIFDRFTIGAPVFWNGDAYQINARLRYRVRDGVLTFWFELIRQDKVLEAATQTLIALIREKTGNPFFFGKPF